MATVTKDFKVKNGLIVEGTTAKVNNFDVLTKKQDDQDYIIGLIGGSSDSANTPNTVVKRDGNGDFAAGEITADLVGDVTGTVSDISNHSTTDLSEGTNKYFTDQRAVDANNGLWDTFGAAVDAQTAAETYAAGLISTEVTNRNNAIDSAISQEVSDRNDAIDNAISQEVSDRNSAISTAITNLDLANTYDALGAADQALSDANDYTDTREIAITTAYQAYADQAETDAVLSANAYADQKVADLVDAAPALLDTLNELAAAIGDDNDFIGTVTASIGEKVAKSGDTMTGDLVMSSNKITSLGAPTANGDAANKLYVDNEVSDALSSANSYTDGEISTLDSAAQGYANSAQSAAESFATNADSALYTTVTGDIATAKSQAESTAQGYANTAETNAENYASDLDSTTNTRIDNLDTDNIAEGSNLYFTDARAKDSAASLLVNATLTNIQITGTGNGGLVITAENGVADSDTDELVEGSSNLYFTDSRAVDALEAVVPNFTAVELNSVAKQVAASLSVPTASTNSAFTWASADYRSAEFLVKIANGSHTDVSKVILTLDTSDNVAITEYGMVGTNGSLGSVSADVDGSDVRLRVTTSNNNSEVLVVGTLLA